jgi:hypothetical protein
MVAKNPEGDITFNVDFSSGSVGLFGKEKLKIDINKDNPYIKATDDNGNYSILDSDQLAFYKAGYPDIPHWYSKRVAYGTSQDGDYIELNWDKQPKVQTAIKNLMSYNRDYPDSDQIYVSFPSEVTKNGFMVNGYTKFPTVVYTMGGSGWFSDTGVDSSGHTVTASSSWTSPLISSGVTRMSVSIRVYGDDGNVPTYHYGLYYKEESASSWTLIDDRYYRNSTGSTLAHSRTYELANLPPANYYIKMTDLRSDYDDHYSVTSIEYEAENIISNGEVMWIAVEGGAD